MSDPQYQEFDYVLKSGKRGHAKVPVADVNAWMQQMDGLGAKFAEWPSSRPAQSANPRVDLNIDPALRKSSGQAPGQQNDAVGTARAELAKLKKQMAEDSERRQAEAQQQATPLESAGYGAAKGASFNSAAKMHGVGASLAAEGNEYPRQAARGMGQPLDERTEYEVGRDRYRQEESQAQRAHDEIFAAAEFGGSAAATAPAAAVMGPLARLAPMLGPAASLPVRMAQGATGATADAALNIAGQTDDIYGDGSAEYSERLLDVLPYTAGGGAMIPALLEGGSRAVRAPLRKAGEKQWKRLKDPGVSPETAQAANALERVGGQPSVRNKVEPGPTLRGEIEEAAAAGAPNAIDHTAGKVATKTTSALETTRSTTRKEAAEAKRAYYQSEEAQNLVPFEEVDRAVSRKPELTKPLRHEAQGQRGVDAQHLDDLRRKLSDKGREYSGKQEHGEARFYQSAAARVRELRDKHYPGLAEIDGRVAKQADEFEATIGALGIKENANEVVDEIGSQHWRKVFDKLVAEDRLPVQEALQKALAADPETLELVQALSGLKGFRSLKLGNPASDVGVSVTSTGPRPRFNIGSQGLALRTAGLKNLAPAGKPGPVGHGALPFGVGDAIAKKLAELKQQEAK